MRPANIITAISDILAGIAIAGYFTKGFENIFWLPIILLCLSTVGLYGGGVVLNDVFDAELDAIERPERPIPSGLIAKKNAALFGSLLLLIGIVAAAFVHPYFISSATLLAIGIAVASVLYDGWGKHHAYLGPLNMGLCRGLNLLLGVSIVLHALQSFWYLGFVPVIYIAAVTTISRGEVHGGKKRVLYFAAFLYSLVLFSILGVAYQNGHLLPALLLILLFAFMIFNPLQKAIQHPVGARIGKAVKAGVLSLIVMNAAWAAAFGQPYLALVILMLLPISLGLAKLFAVT
jgi:1,4-dihydroxy-2-naphthoate octaprenyltransferase